MKLENPISVEYLQKHLHTSLPRLMLNDEREAKLRTRIKTDPVVKGYYKAIKRNAYEFQDQPLLTREMTGRRLLSVSREMLYRMNMLAMVWRLDKDTAILQRIGEEVNAVCGFSDWNPSHFLDTAEMSLAVALALDWTAGELPDKTRDLALEALIEKGVQPSWQESMPWVQGDNNWNQVCHGGMIAASIAIVERDPSLAAKTIKRALDGIPCALAEYAPDGVYPEGAAYWSYGTAYTIMTIEMLRTALGSDFGIPKAPGFMESALFFSLSRAPSGCYFNFADCRDKRLSQNETLLAWFAAETGDGLFFEKKYFDKDALAGRLDNHSGAGLIWLAGFEQKKQSELPAAWCGRGSNPVAIFKEEDYYFGGKGGRGGLSHGNMDGGSFIFELAGIRWVVDPGVQDYHELEKQGFKLWESGQDSERWKLLTKNNFGHSTLTVDDKLHAVDGQAQITDFQAGPRPQVTIDLTPAFEGRLALSKRTFTRDTARSLLIEDTIVVAPQTEKIAWQLITQADVALTEQGAMLSQDNKLLKLENLSHPDADLKIVSLDPPPFKLDKVIKGLKRVELNLTGKQLAKETVVIHIRLSEIK